MSAAVSLSRAAESLDGKTIFLAEKCNLCHSVPPAGIEASIKSEKLRGPDLVNLKPPGEVLAKYLRKDAQIDGKEHKKAFTGSDEELGALVAWLLAQEEE